MKEKLLNLQSEQFKKFSEKIINTKYPIMGVKTDILKKMAKDNISDYKEYFKQKHIYYEEYMIHGFMLGYLKVPFNELIKYVDEYINLINCWSMVDSIVSNLKIFKKHINEIFTVSKQYINSNEEFRVRFGYCTLLTYFINDSKKEYLEEILNLCNKEHNKYYIQMMVAWLLSVAYVKFKEEVLHFLYITNIDDFTFNKTISKICDSYRVTKEEKEILKKMRRKNESNNKGY